MVSCGIDRPDVFAAVQVESPVGSSGPAGLTSALTPCSCDRRARPWGTCSRVSALLHLRLGALYWPIAMSDKTPVVHSDPEILNGTPVFVGTRVPVHSLFDYIEGGDTLDEFLRQFTSVRREQAIAALELARESLLTRARTT